PDYAPGIVMGFIHHTDNANGYSRAAVPGIIRSIYAYHVNSNGWCDVGYIFLVDRFGRIWEGRYGGITKAVVGAHTGGFNTDSFGVSLIGTFTSHAPSSAMLRAVDKLFAWKLGTAYRDPRGKSQLTAGSFSGSRFAAGRTVTFDTVSGHRDADFTDCPGGAAYRDLPSIRNAIAARMGAGFVSPALSTASVMMAGPPVTVSAHVVGTQTWTLTVRDSHGTVVASVPGTAKRSSPVAASWDLTDNGVPVPPGSYALELTGADAAGDSAVPWQASLDVTPPVALTAPSQVALGQPVSVRGRGVPGHHVTVDVTGPGGSVRGTFPVGSDGRWRTTSPVSATGDLDWTVTDTAITGYSRRRTTRVAPAIASPTSSPVLVAAGSAVQVKGSALPSAGPLRLVTQHPGGSPAVTGAAIPVASDGSWSTSFTPTGPTTFWTTDSRGLTSIRRDAYSVSAPAASAPATGYAGRSVRVAGDAGGAPVAVTLRRRLPGGSWTDVRTVTAATDGHFTMQLPLPAAAGGTAATPVRWGIVTSYGAPVTGQVSVQPVFPPTVTGPARVSWNVIALLTGTGVPGDHVIVWTAPAGSSGWVRQGRVTAASDKSWSFALPVTADTAWRVSSPSGTSASGVTVVVPTLHVPSSVASGTRVTFRGRAIPGQTVTLERRLSGATAWTVVRRTTATSNGTWSLRRTVRNAAGYRAVSHGQQSHTRVVSVS
ncbi:MAG: N-acetylmuramoyl-L-alanine amidase, partial [Frankiales bacterium]|nr:N-acetylmuramoyl-L-alanine amidase [Frankiales bacterium]